MAISKIHEIRSTLGKSIAYITNPTKTEEYLYVDSFSCSPVTAAEEMEATARKGSGRGNRIAYHLIQSFSPDENIAPEIAFAIGKEYASAVTGQNYEYVIATHNDRGHLHNHIIFNATSFITYKKYHHGKEDIDRLMELNDVICAKKGLSVITEKSGRKGKTRKEYEDSKKGISWKDILADLIDAAVSESTSFEEFIERLNAEGVSVSMGKHIAFRCESLGMKRACRGKRIGTGYTEEALRAKIEGDELFLKKEKLKNPKTKKTEKTKQAATKKERQNDSKERSIFTEASRSDGINLLVETGKLEKAKTSVAYAHKVDQSNISNLIKTQNWMANHNIKTFDELCSFESSLKDSLNAYENVLTSNKKVKKELHEKIDYVQKYKKNIGVFIEWRRGGSRANFYAEHKEIIDTFQEAKMYFDSIGVAPKDLKLSQLFDEYRATKKDIDSLSLSIKEKRKFLKETSIVRKNMEMVLNLKKKEEQDSEVDAKSNSKQRREKKNDYSI